MSAIRAALLHAIGAVPPEPPDPGAQLCALVKGDLPGHPFRGNQYKPGDRVERPALSPAKYPANVRQGTVVEAKAGTDNKGKTVPGYMVLMDVHAKGEVNPFTGKKEAGKPRWYTHSELRPLKTTSGSGLRATVVRGDTTKELSNAQARMKSLLEGGVNPRSHTVVRLRREIEALSKPKKSLGAVLLAKFREDQPRAPAGEADGGQWTDTGGPGAGTAGWKDRLRIAHERAKAKGVPLTDRQIRAIKFYKKSDQAKQALAEKGEAKIAALVGKDAARVPGNGAMDVVFRVGRQEIGIEIKSVMDNKNDKLTVHPHSRERKEAWRDRKMYYDQKGQPRRDYMSDPKSIKRSLHVVMWDTRTDKVWYRPGVGAYRLYDSTGRINRWTEVKNTATMRRLLGVKP